LPLKFLTTAVIIYSTLRSTLDEIQVKIKLLFIAQQQTNFISSNKPNNDPQKKKKGHYFIVID